MKLLINQLLPHSGLAASSAAATRGCRALSHAARPGLRGRAEAAAPWRTGGGGPACRAPGPAARRGRPQARPGAGGGGGGRAGRAPGGTRSWELIVLMQVFHAVMISVSVGLHV